MTFDLPTRSFRPITGSLGSAFLGPAVLGDFDQGSVAPHKNYGVAFRDGRCFLVSVLDSQQASTTMLPGCLNLPEDVAWSADGSTAILYSRTDGWVQVLTGLPDSPTSGAVVSISPGSRMSAVAADDDGSHILIGKTGDMPGVYLLGKDQALALILSLANPTALAVAGTTAYAVDAGTSQVFELSLADWSSQSWRFDGLTDPVAIQPSRDAAMRNVIYIAGGSDRTLWVYDAGSHNPIAPLPVDFVPTMMVPLGNHSFLLRPRLSQDEPLWSFASDSPPMAYFIPAAPLTVSGGLQ